MNLIIRRTTGEVVMYADGKIGIEDDTLESIEYDLTEEQLKMLTSNYPAKMLKGVLTFEQSLESKKKEDQETQDALMAVAKDESKSVEVRLDAMLGILEQKTNV